MADSLEIRRRDRDDPHRRASLDRFTVCRRDGVPSAAVFANPNITPYCLSLTDRELICAEIPPECCLASAPFYYQVQLEQATRLYAVPWDEVVQWQRTVAAPVVPKVLVYGIARSGATLVASILRKIPGAVVLAEPDVLDDLARMAPVHDQAIRRDLTRGCVELLGRGAASSPLFALKFRGTGIGLAEVLRELYPDSRALFTIRDAADVAASCLRLWDQDRLRRFTSFLRRRRAVARDRAWLASESAELDRIRALRGCSVDQLLELEAALPYVLEWLAAVEEYERLRERGHPIAAVSYERLCAEPKATIASIFAHCAIDASGEMAATALGVDSQEGTELSRRRAGAVTLDHGRRQVVRAVEAGLAPLGVPSGVLAESSPKTTDL
ncbi:MAG: hypothetical protein EXQ49_07750 [Acidobacteria bacterium]|nr:hypothetical protein [Acidobacteriota bacterium]